VNTHAQRLREVAAHTSCRADVIDLLRAADELEQLSRLACERRDSIARQIELRVAAEARAGRLGRDARR
jgi:hypothetical protein